MADPYSIALSKIDRGADTDYDDLLFLLQHGHVVLEKLETMLADALPHAKEFDLDPDIREHMQELKNRLE